jgi:hypothetical protein
VKVLPGLGQLAWRQPTSGSHGRQAPLPLQVPSFEQSPAPGLLAAQRCLGSDCPLATNEHLPTLPATLQLLQSPPVEASEQAPSQQTPSVQKPEAHWLPPEQAAPLLFTPQDPFAHVLGDLQSASTLQAVLQAFVVGLQT